MKRRFFRPLLCVVDLAVRLCILAHISFLLRIRMLPRALNHSFSRPRHVHIHERTSRLNQLRCRDNLSK